MSSKKTKNSRGVIYHVFDSYDFVEECLYSLKTFKKFHPDIPVTLFTNLEVKNKHKKQFDNIETINIKLPKFVYKVFCLLRSPYDYTLYLDGDTEIRQTVYELFDFLDYYDFIFTRAIEFNFTKTPWEFISYMDMKHCNAGIILFSNSVAAKKFLDKWYEASSTVQFERVIGERRFSDYDDQMALNYLLHEQHFENEIGMMPLFLPSKIYNAVTYAFPEIKKDNQYHLIKIAHGHELFRQQLRYKIADKIRLIKIKYLTGKETKPKD